MVPLWRDSLLLMSRLAGAIFSGGGDAEFGGATWTYGLEGSAGCGFCAIAGPAISVNAISESVRDMIYPDPTHP
jgi:hypothetical protein